MSSLSLNTLFSREDKRAWVIPALLLLLVLLVVRFGPEEQTLGSGIRTVYVHVGLIWTGLTLFGIVALLGLGLLIRPDLRVAAWMRTVGWAAIGFYAAGIGMSMVASRANWGAVFLQEPRMASALNGLALAVIVLIVNTVVPSLRLRGLLVILLLAALLWLNGSAQLVLHPPNPVRTSNSIRIQLTFLSVFALFSLMAGWVCWYWPPRSAS